MSLEAPRAELDEHLTENLKDVQSLGQDPRKFLKVIPFLIKAKNDFRQMTDHGLPPDRVLTLIIARQEKYAEENEMVKFVRLRVAGGELALEAKREPDRSAVPAVERVY